MRTNENYNFLIFPLRCIQTKPANVDGATDPSADLTAKFNILAAKTQQVSISFFIPEEPKEEGGGGAAVPAIIIILLLVVGGYFAYKKFKGGAAENKYELKD